MLEVIGAGNPDYSGQDWGDTWANSTEYKELMEEINQIIDSRRGEKDQKDQKNKTDDKEFAMPLWVQIMATTKRTFIAYWRTPEYALVRILVQS